MLLHTVLNSFAGHVFEIVSAWWGDAAAAGGNWWPLDFAKETAKEEYSLEFCVKWIKWMNEWIIKKTTNS